MVKLVTPFATLAVYDVVPEENVGDTVPELMVRPDRVESVLTRASLVTVMV